MRPLRGVVVGGGRKLKVRMASGRIVSVPHTKGVRRWDAVDVFWDSVKGRAVAVEKRVPDGETYEVSSEPETLHEIGEEPPKSECLDSGALNLCVGEAGDSEYWELVLSDGSLAAAGYV